MNSRHIPDRREREGYVSLLAMSFAFGLAVFGGALAVGLRAYITSSTAEQRDILDRITLESAANDTLGRLAAGESHSIKPSTLVDIVYNQRTASVELSLPEGKYDLQEDPARLWMEALRRHGLAARGPAPAAIRFDTLADLSRAWRLSASEEDCMRTIMTLGRAPEALRPDAAEGGGEGLDRSAVAGDQVDLRVSLGSPAKVLWARARLTGAVDQPWRLHDYRLLQRDTPGTACVTD